MKDSGAFTCCTNAILRKRRGLLLVVMWVCATPLFAASVQPGCDSNRQCSGGALCETWSNGQSPIERCVVRTDGIGVILNTITASSDYPPGFNFPISGIELSGAITHDKVARLRELMMRYKPVMPPGIVGAWFNVTINSLGGNVYAAMELGRLFRANQVSIALDRGAVDRPRCASACIFAWAGAPMRLLGGMPGDDQALVIHRPYGFADAGQDFSASSGRWKTLQADIRQYLLEMNVPPALLDAMNEVSSEDGRALTPAELSRYLLSADDPAFSDLRDAADAKKRGVSRTECLTRKRRAEECKERTSNEVDASGDQMATIRSLDAWIAACDKLYDTAADGSARPAP